MTLAASLQWDLLPPLVFKSPPVTVAGILEPAYEVGGDCFDYSINWPVLDVALMDSMGHGVNSAILASLALGCYRHDRRHGKSLTAMHQELEATVRHHYGAGSSSPGNWRSSTSRPDCCSGPMPAIPCRCISGAARSSEISACPPTLPWGLGAGVSQPVVAEISLEPGDAVLFYTDGVIEGRARSGGGFGLDRLVDVVGQNASDQIAAEEDRAPHRSHRPRVPRRAAGRRCNPGHHAVAWHVVAKYSPRKGWHAADRVWSSHGDRVVRTFPFGGECRPTLRTGSGGEPRMRLCGPRAHRE